MNKPHYNIVFATPGHSSLMSYVRSILKTVNELDRRGITWNYLTEYSSHVANARERTIGGTGFNNMNQNKPADGAFTYDMIMWIDSDIAWEPEDVLRLYQSDKEIISGCYMLEDRTVTVYLEPLGPAMLEQDLIKHKKPFIARGVGFGFLAVKNGVFEKMSRPWFNQMDIEVRNKETGEFEYKFPIVGEDLSWCEKAYRSGKSVWVDPLVRVTHHKQTKLEWKW